MGPCLHTGALPRVPWSQSERADFLPLCLQRRELLRDDMLQKIEAEEENLKKQQAVPMKTQPSPGKNVGGRMPRSGQPAPLVSPLLDGSPVRDPAGYSGL